MTLTHTQKTKAAKSGMTLIELTVVILVLLSLISILFVGARAWKRGSDRAASILEIRNVKQAVRSEQNINNANPGDPTLDPTVIFGADNYIAVDPTVDGHPAGSTYTYSITDAATYPALSTLYMTVTGGADPAYYMPADTTGW